MGCLASLASIHRISRRRLTFAMEPDRAIVRLKICSLNDFKTPMKSKTSERRWLWPHENWERTVGGGTSFGTARECLETLGCYGNGKSKRFAEIIAATAMAGEISLMISIVNGTYIYAHETFGRNRPPQ
jgi:hypothetical protein